jgi:hypothetical protein
MGSQIRSSLRDTGPGVAHYTQPEINQIKSALDYTPTEAGQAVSAKVLLSVLAATNPFFATVVSAIALITLIQKIAHYAEIAERDGTDAAVLAIMKDIAEGAIRQYLTDSTIESLTDSENITPESREILELIVGMVIDQGIDKVEEAFLNE